MMRPSPAAGPARGTRRRILTAAAALTLVVGGLFALTNRDPQQPAGRDVATRILPGWIPGFISADNNPDARPMALVELRSDPERDRIAYASADASMSVELDRTRGAPIDGEPISVRGAPGRRTSSTLSWLGPDDALIEVSWSGSIDEVTIESFVRSVAYVDHATWIEATATGGFRENDFDPLTTVRVDADVAFDVDLVGDLHDGLRLEVGSSGFPVSSVGRCAASLNSETTDPGSDATGYVVLADGATTSVVLSTTGNDVRRIDLTSLLPLLDVSIGGAVYEQHDPSSDWPSVVCGAES